MKPITKVVFTSILTSAAHLGLYAQDAPPEQPKWEASASAGLTITRGNSESTSANVGAKAEKKWDMNEIRLGIDGIYGKTKTDGVETKSAETLLGYAQYNRLVTEALYGYIRVEGLHDGVAGIRYRLTVSPGVGYYFIKTERTQLDGEVGPGFVYEKTQDGEDTYMTLRLAENFKHAFNERVRVWQKAEFLPQVDDFENYILNFEVGIEADLTEKLSFQSKLLDTYDNEPVPGRKANDLKWINAISYKF